MMFGWKETEEELDVYIMRGNPIGGEMLNRLQ